MGDVGAPELLIILAVILVMFGGAKLPELARSLGKAKREFQKGIDEGMSGHQADTADAELPAAEPPATEPAIEAGVHPSSEAAANGATTVEPDTWWKEHQT